MDSTDKYIPVSCSFHDGLLEKATFKTKCNLLYKSSKQTIEVSGIITDVFTKNKEEFLVLNKGLTIRLDKIISLNNETPGLSNFHCA